MEKMLFLPFMLTFVYFADCNHVDLNALELQDRLIALEKFVKVQKAQSLHTVTLLENYQMFLEDQSAVLVQQEKDNALMFKKFKEEDEKLRKDLDGVIQGCGGTVTDTDQFDVNAILKTIGKLRSELRRGKVSFFALVRDSIPVKSKKTVVYRHVLFNDANAFSGNTGIFTAPTAGRYVFYVTTLARGGFIETAIEVNKKRMAFVYCASIDRLRGKYNYGSGSNSFLFHLKKGDTVRVVIGAGSRAAFVFTRYSTFSGFLL